MRNIGRADIPDCVERLLHELRELGRNRSLRDPIAQAFEDLQFTPAQIHSLLWLGSDGALTMGELAHRVAITEKTITGVVDRLEQEGYLQRERDGEDRRVVRARLTRKGLGVFKKLDDHLHEKTVRILGLLDPEDRQAFIRIVQKLRERLPRLAPNLEERSARS